MLSNAGAVIEAGNEQATAVHAVDRLYVGLDDTSLGLIMVQMFPQGFGVVFFETMLRRIETGLFGGKVLTIFCGSNRSCVGQGMRSHPENKKVLAATLVRLLDTDNGRHFLDLEKGKVIDIGDRVGRPSRPARRSPVPASGERRRGLHNEELFILSGRKMCSRLLVILSFCHFAKDAEILLYPSEEHLHLPATFVQFGDYHC